MYTKEIFAAQQNVRCAYLKQVGLHNNN